MPLQATSGAASYDGFGGGVAAVPNYIEDVFSTWLYSGNSSTQTITNSIDLSTKGGLVWLKGRSVASSNFLFDTARGVNKYLLSNLTNAQDGTSTNLTAFNTNGFNITSAGGQNINDSGVTYASWTFRKQPKFFDVVTYTGDGIAGKTISHNLGSAPGCIIVKCTNAVTNWAVYNQAIGASAFGYLSADAAWNLSSTAMWNGTAPTSTQFTVGSNGNVNTSGNTYVAYLFAHDAGGFGLTGTDNVISCGSVSVTNGSYATVNLGYEPQFVLIKNTTAVGNWFMNDSMRSMPAQPSLAASLMANTSAAETAGDGPCFTTSTGFTVNNNNTTGTYIYIAIRRGPMKVPTDATKVFQPLTRSGTGGATTVTSTVRPDTVLQNWRSGGLGSADHFMYDRLRGVAKALFTDTTDAESTQTATGINAFNNLSYGIAGAGSMNNGSALYADYVFTRAPSFFDEVCYTGTGSGSTQITHNLQALPELIICKSRSSAINWSIACNVGGMNYVRGLASAFGFNSTNAATQTVDFTGVISSTYFKPTTIYGAADDANQSGVTYVAYLFATCAGVSKVGSYTGTGATQTISCGFTGGARFVLIKRTDTTGDWWVWDTARGIVAGNDPYLLLNTTAAEVTTTDYIDTYSAGFEISSTAPAAINASGGTYIFLAIA